MLDRIKKDYIILMRGVFNKYLSLMKIGNKKGVLRMNKTILNYLNFFEKMEACNSF